MSGSCTWRATRTSSGSIRELLEDILDCEEDHADWLETQLTLIRQLGDVQYLAQQLGD